MTNLLPLREVLFLLNKMFKKSIFILYVFVTLLVTNSCKKTPGQGGNAQIKGTFWVRQYDPFFTIITGRYPAINQTIYLFFGDETSPGVTVNTNDQGEFQFDYLRKGKYRVVAYSRQYRATTTTPASYAVETVVNLSKRKEVKDIGLDTLNQ